MALKLEIPSITFAYLLQELKELENSLVTKVQELQNNWIRFRLLTKTGQRDLVFTNNAFFCLQYSMQAKQQSSGFGGFLNKHLKMKKLLAIKQLNFERVFFFEFSEHTLVAELFSKGNLILLDDKCNIMMPKRAEQWSSRTIKRGLPYKEPPLMENPANISFEKFCKLMRAELKIVPALVKLAGIAPVIAEEACFLAKIQPSEQASKLSKEQLKTLYSTAKSFYTGISLEKESPVLIEHKGKQVLVPFKLKSFSDKELRTFKSVNEALNELLVLQTASKGESTNLKIAELEHSLVKQKQTLEKTLEAASELKKKGELIYVHFNDISAALEFAKRELLQKRGEKVVMYNKSFGRVILKEIDFKKKKARIEIKEAK